MIFRLRCFMKFLSQSQKIAQIKTASLRYASQHCCCCIKKLVCHTIPDRAFSIVLSAQFSFKII